MSSKAIQVCALLLAAVTLIAGCSPSETTQFVAEAPLAGLAPPGRFFVDGASESAVPPYSPGFADLAQFADLVDVVFVGTITGSVRNLADDGPDENDPTGAVIEYDGIQFNVEEVLRGELPDPKVAVIAQPVLLRVPSDPAFVDVPLLVQPVQTVRGGIDAVDQGSESPRYLVFARYSEFKDGQRELTFFGDGSVAEIGKDDVLVSNKVPPFVQTRANENAYGQDMTVDFVRDWINGEPPSVIIPEKFWPTEAEPAN